MKKIKSTILLTLILFLAMTVLTTFGQVKAATGTLILNIKMLKNSGYGYKVNEKNVWKIYEVGGNADDTIYCLKGGPGFGSSDFASGAPKQTEYTKYFNLKEPSTIPTTYQVALPDINSETYKALLWVLDNCYVAPKTNASDSAKAQAAKSRKILLEAAENYAAKNGNPDILGGEFDYLTDDDIDTVQQLAVWYYTNQEGDPYHINTFEFWLNAVSGTDANYKALSSTNPSYFENGEERAAACQALFDYLVQTPTENDFSYDLDSDLITKPIQIANTQATIKAEGDKLIIGPYRLEELTNIEYDFEYEFTDGNDEIISDIVLLDSNLVQVQETTTLKDLVGQNFYISVSDTTNATKITFNITGTYFTTTATYWSVENPDPSKDQPVVKLEKTENTFTDSLQITKEPEKVFDLALRKFITSINQVNPVEDRTPQISVEELEKLNNDSTTTANKVHPKTPLEVKTGDKVIYTIRVYNEGEIDGYATEITDHLPTGLKFLPDSQINKDNGWSNPSGDGKTIISSKLAETLISAFDGTNLNYADLQIECEVIATVKSENQNLKNVAEITSHKDKDGNADILDRDSVPNSLKPTDIENYGQTSKQDDDDFEHLVLLGKYFDLSLRKFITTVTSGEKVKNYERAPQVDVTKLVEGTSTTAIYNHNKTPIGVTNGDEVIYTIRVYNEGELDGYVTEITDHLPEQLEFIVDDELNAKYAWTVSSDGRTVKTDIISPKTTNSASRDEIYKDRANGVLLKAFDGEKLDYIDVQIKCRVKENITMYQKITNIADITGFTDENGNVIQDRDSQEKNVVLPDDTSLPNYKDTEIERGDEYIPGQQDDDDFEKLVLQRFDLALRKFITGVNEKEITSRAPVFTKTEDGKYTYVHPKDPVEVANANIVTYTLRIFNEGNLEGYASEIKDDLPEGLGFLPENEINIAYGWKMYTESGEETKDVSEASYIKTDFLSKEKEIVEEDNLLGAFNPETMTMPDYKDVKIAFKVLEPNTSDRIIINTAEITKDSDKDGNEVDDIDSTPDNGKEKEDDIDIEKIKVKYFDLSLKKWVTESIVTYDGKTTITKTGHTGDENPEAPAKVDIRGSRIDKTTVKFKFNIKVTNEGEIAGYASELIDYVPEGLVFKAEDNPKWKEENGRVTTDQLKDTLLQPGESATVEIILTWINNKDNLGLKTNWAEISKDDNSFDSPDIDSTPDNNKPEEDDIDEAPVILAVTTGSIPTYISLILASVSVLAVGIILIKKFVI